MGEYKDWLADKSRNLPVSELTVAIFPESPRGYIVRADGSRRPTPEYKAYLEDVRRSTIMPARRAVLKSDILK